MLSHRQWVVALVAVVVFGAMAAVLRSNGIDRAQRSVSTGGITTILVVPFTIIGSESETSSGGQLSEQVRMALSKDTSLETRRSEMQPANAQLAAARRAAAYYVLRGTVDQKPRGVEISLRLVRASDASTAWSGTFWKSVADLPSSAGDLASAVSEAIRAEHDSEARRHARQSSRTQQPR